MLLDSDGIHNTYWSQAVGQGIPTTSQARQVDFSFSFGIGIKYFLDSECCLPLHMWKLLTVRPTTSPDVSGTSLSPRVSDPDYLQPGSIFDILEKHSALNAAYNSFERASEHASTCQEGTREAVVSKILAWVERGDRPICWLEGPAALENQQSRTPLQCGAMTSSGSPSVSFFRGGGKIVVMAQKFSPRLHTNSPRSYRWYKNQCCLLSKRSRPFSPHIFKIRSSCS